MIFKRLEYLDEKGNLAGLVGFIEERAIPKIFISKSSRFTYSWSIIIGNTVIRDVETDYDGTYMSLYFKTDIPCSELSTMIVQLTLIPDAPPCRPNHIPTILCIQDICHKPSTVMPIGEKYYGGEYELMLEEPSDRYLHDIIYHSRGGSI